MERDEQKVIHTSDCFNQKTPATIVAVNLHFDEHAVFNCAPQ